jgi:hypothetical protein
MKKQKKREKRENKKNTKEEEEDILLFSVGLGFRDTLLV